MSSATSRATSASILDGCEVGAPFSLEADLLADAVASTRFDLFETKGLFIDIGLPEDYAPAQALLAGRWAGRRCFSTGTG